MLNRRLAAVSARISEIQKELRIVDDQLSHLVDDADEKSLRALVAETPAAEFEHREARRHSDAMLRHRASLTGSLADLNVDPDMFSGYVKSLPREAKVMNGPFNRHVMTVFQRAKDAAQQLGGKLVEPEAITQTGLLTIEGERDDISGVGQTEAAHDICSKIPKARKKHHLQKGVGHYGVFSGSKFRAEVAPVIADFLLAQKA